MSEDWNPGGASYDPQGAATPTWQPPPPTASAPVAAVTPHWAMAVISILLFWPLGIAACVYAAKVKPALQLGDVASALRSSGRVKVFFWISLAVFVLYLLIIIGSASGSGSGG
ncbi:MAG TPA: CD225/dispanin family protein [Streptosporangiaceae bacterium]|nr:CD225/dispanin family protein [Streptosporangiaceae bacterium]